jgi:hypothetical protein
MKIFPRPFRRPTTTLVPRARASASFDARRDDRARTPEWHIDQWFF